MAHPLADPYRIYNVHVKVSGIDDGQFYFTKCSSFSAAVENNKYVEGGSKSAAYQIPNQVNLDPVTLSYGVTESRALLDWLTKAAAGTAERKNVAIQIMSDDGSSTKELWELISAWPQKWQGVETDAASSEIAIEQLTLVFEQFNRLQK